MVPSEFCFPEGPDGPYIKCFVVYLDFPFFHQHVERSFQGQVILAAYYTSFVLLKARHKKKNKLILLCTLHKDHKTLES